MGFEGAKVPRLPRAVHIVMVVPWLGGLHYTYRRRAGYFGKKEEARPRGVLWVIGLTYPEGYQLAESKPA
jgi:hypothetical protein